MPGGVSVRDTLSGFWVSAELGEEENGGRKLG